jgi:hypothetical protein
MGRAMFDVDRFIVDCRNAAATSGLPAVLDVVAGAVSTPGPFSRVSASHDPQTPTCSTDRRS